MAERARGGAGRRDRPAPTDPTTALSNAERARGRTGEQRPADGRAHGSSGRTSRPGGDASHDSDAGLSHGSGLYGSTTGQNMARAATAELIGTAILVFAGTAVACAAILDQPTAGAAYDSLSIALAFGLTLAALVAGLGHISGAHLNPAVTLGLAATGRFPTKHVALYLGAQLIGAVLGAVATWIAYGGAARTMANLAATYPTQGTGLVQALVVEALVTFVLVLTVIAVATDDRVPDAVAPLAVGFALTAGVLIAGPVTGGAVNPARALGPMLVAFDLSSFWVYVVGPVVGGVAAALVYARLLEDAEPPE